MSTHQPTHCADCGNWRIHRGRGLCNACYVRNRVNGTLIDYERTNRPREELLSEWALLESEGFTRRQAAERLGITKKALEKAIERERRAQERAA